MYYKLTLEKLDHFQNTIKTTTVVLTEEMVNDFVSLDYLKMAADQLVDKFRHEHNENINKND
jgi:hypothetical protein